MGKIGIVPDVHGREFWKVLKDKIDEFDKVVFLGDYVSPYPDEGITNDRAIEILKEVVDFKKGYPNKVVLLLGNHDWSYINTEICECRTDFKNWAWLNRFYMDNIKLFDLAWETKIGEKRYFFSHAGVRKGWFDTWVKNDLFRWDSDELPEAWMFNNLLHAAYDDYNEAIAGRLELAIGIYSYYRGWTGDKDGSIVWADIREYTKGEDEGLENEYENVVFVCGHTQLDKEPIIGDWVMDLDCRKPFVLYTETGKVEEYK